MDLTLCSFIGCKNEKCERFIKNTNDTMYCSIAEFPQCEFWEEQKGGENELRFENCG